MRRMWQGNDRQTIALNSDIPNDISSTAGLYSQRVGTAAGPTKEKFRLKYFIQNRIYMLLEDVCCVHLRSKPNVTIHKNGLAAHRQLNQSQCFALWRVHFEKWKDVFTRFSPIVGKGKITSSIIACPPFCDAIRSSSIGNKFSTFFLGFPDDAVIVDAGEGLVSIV